MEFGISTGFNQKHIIVLDTFDGTMDTPTGDNFITFSQTLTHSLQLFLPFRLGSDKQKVKHQEKKNNG